MGKSVLTIHRELAKKEHAKSPLGKLEKELSRFYDEMILKKKQLPEEFAEQIYDIRDNQEQWMLDYIERTNLEQKKAIDDKLFESMTKELEVINKYRGTIQNL